MTAPGWYKDAHEPEKARWHDGTEWTEHTVVMADWQGKGMPPAPGMQPAFSATESPAPRSQRSDARADAAASKARAKAMRPWFKKKRIMIPLVLLGVIILGAIASSGSDKKDNVTADQTTVAGQTTVKSVNSGSHPAADDVQLTSCEADGFGGVTIGVTIVNHTSKTSNYVVEINVNDPAGTKVGDGAASTNNLAAGQTAKVTGYATSSAKGAVSCVTAAVTRYAS